MSALIDDITALPDFDAIAEDPDPIVHVRLFTPGAAATWLVCAVERRAGRLIGFGWAEVVPGAGECGTFDLDEIATLRGRFGLGVERDRYYQPRPLSDAIRKEIR